MDNPLVQPDPGLFIWTILTFLVLVALLAKFAWRPLLQALESRQESIRKSLDDAEKAKQELERLHAESAEIIRQSRVEADAIVTRSRGKKGNRTRAPRPMRSSTTRSGRSSSKPAAPSSKSAVKRSTCR